MSEALLYTTFFISLELGNEYAKSLRLQGYLTYKKTHPPRTLQKAYAYGPMEGGGCFLMSEAPLYIALFISLEPGSGHVKSLRLQEYLTYKKAHPSTLP